MNTQKIISSVAIAASVLLPVMALAYTSVPQPTGNINSVDAMVSSILNVVWPIFIGLAVIMIIISGFLFLTSSGDAEKVKTARTALIWAVIGIVVAIVAYSIPKIVQIAIGG